MPLQSRPITAMRANMERLDGATGQLLVRGIAGGPRGHDELGLQRIPAFAEPCRLCQVA